MSSTQSDKTVYHTETSKQAEQIRGLLLKLKPRPFVYVYPIESGYDISVASEWGTSMSEEGLLEVKQYLIEEMAAAVASEN
jgi:hypothetical protein